MDVDIKIDANIDEKLKTFPELVVESKEIAEAIRLRAQSLADYKLKNPTGKYAAGIIVQPIGRGLPSGYRVLATDNKSSWIEFGNSHQPALWIIRDAAESMGLKFKKGKAK